jgi:D-glycero-D-manno-heptose 1,7-bisphosphate phosphatase
MQFDQTWSLFLDRDGVVNKRWVNDYVKSWSEFIFENHVLEAMITFSQIFGRIFIVTNQQGIAKGLMTIEDLQHIHRQLIVEVKKAGGRIDRIYFCPHAAQEHCNCRKPKTGMALQAKADFPEVDFTKSVMVGDSPSDIEMGYTIGMKTVFIGLEHPPPHTHWQFANLKSFADFSLC